MSTTAREKAMIVGLLGAASGAATGLVLGAIVGSKATYEYEDDRIPTITASVSPGQFGTTAAWRF